MDRGKCVKQTVIQLKFLRRYLTILEKREERERDITIHRRKNADDIIDEKSKFFVNLLKVTKIGA